MYSVSVFKICIDQIGIKATFKRLSRSGADHKPLTREDVRLVLIKATPV